MITDMNKGEYLFMKDGNRIREARFNYYLKKACNEIVIFHLIFWDVL